MQMPYPIWTLGMLFFLQCNKPLDTEWKVIERYSDGKKKTENKLNAIHENVFFFGHKRTYWT